MAVLCPAYDPLFGWYVIVFGPDGPKKKLIVSPLHYYKKIGVSPPVGAVFSDDDYFNLEDILNYEEDADLDDQISGDPYDLPPLVKVSPKSSVAPIIPEAGLSDSLPETSNNLLMPKVSDCPPQNASIIPEVGIPKSSLIGTDYPPQYAPIIPEVGFQNSSLKATDCPPQYAPIIPEAGFPKSSLKTTDCPPQYAPIIPEVGFPMSTLKTTDCPPQYAPIIPKVGFPMSSMEQYAQLLPDIIVAKISEDNEPTFISSTNVQPIYNQAFNKLYNHNDNTSSFELQPSTSSTFQDLYSSGYLSSFNKNLMLPSYDNYDEDDDYNMEISYDDPYGEPHNM